MGQRGDRRRRSGSYEASDPDDGPYDPNDDAAVDRFLTESNRIDPVPRPKDRKAAKAS